MLTGSEKEGKADVNMKGMWVRMYKWMYIEMYKLCNFDCINLVHWMYRCEMFECINEALRGRLQCAG